MNKRIEVCGKCFGTGEYTSEPARRVNTCGMCSGRGYVEHRVDATERATDSGAKS